MTQMDQRSALSADMDASTVRALLTTTRSVRRRLDLEKPVDSDVINECLSLAVQAPNAAARQTWRWFVLTDPERRKIIADYVRIGWIEYNRRRPSPRRLRGADARASRRMLASAQWLVDNLDRVPVLVIPCLIGAPITDEAQRQLDALNSPPSGIQFRARLQADSTYYGSIYPAIWSFQLALRSYGLGSTITTFHLFFHDLIAQEIGIPRNATQIALIPVAHTKGDEFRPAPRLPASEVTIWNDWIAPRPDADIRELIVGGVHMSGRREILAGKGQAKPDSVKL